MNVCRQCHMRRVLVILMISIFLVSCASNQTGDQETTGTIIGGMAGAAIGQLFGKGVGRAVATAAGVAVGAYIGNRIGNYLDEKDKKELANATEQALSGDPTSPETVTWENPETGVKGEVIAEPSVTKDVPDSAIVPGTSKELSVAIICRTVKQSVMLSDGKIVKEEQRFCQKPDGNWEAQA